MKSQLTGMRGVYLVAAELSRLGFIASAGGLGKRVPPSSDSLWVAERYCVGDAEMHDDVAIDPTGLHVKAFTAQLRPPTNAALLHLRVGPGCSASDQRTQRLADSPQCGPDVLHSESMWRTALARRALRRPRSHLRVWGSVRLSTSALWA